MIELHCETVPYSSIVGGGLMLLDKDGKAMCQLSLRGTTQGITKDENDTLCLQIANLINRHGISVEFGEGKVNRDNSC